MKFEKPALIKKWFDYPEWIILAAAAIILFLNLGAWPVQNWDEARNAQNAYEMVKSGNFIRHTYLDEPEYWNSKPPLLFWSIALSFKAFGVNAFALRLPSAIFALLTLAIMMFIARKLYDKKAAFFSGLILSTAYGFMHYHSARKGDFDSLLALCVALALLFFIESERRRWLLLFSGLATGLAFLTKSFAVFQIFGILGCAMLFKKYRERLLWKGLLFWLIGAALPVLTWVFLRYQSDGLLFFQAMLGNDMVSRTTQSVDGLHTFSLLYFGIILIQFAPWGPFLFFIPFYKNKLKLTRDGDAFLIKAEFNPFYKEPIIMLWAIVPFILFSMVTTKVDWYMVPLYPALSILIGWHIARWDEDRLASQKPLRSLWTVATLGFLILFIFISGLVVHQQEKDSDQPIWMSLKPLNPNAKVVFLGEERNQADVFIANAMRGFPVRVEDSLNQALSNLQPGDLFFTRNTKQTNTGLSLETNSSSAWWFKK